MRILDDIYKRWRANRRAAKRKAQLEKTLKKLEEREAEFKYVCYWCKETFDRRVQLPIPANHLISRERVLCSVRCSNFYWGLH